MVRGTKRVWSAGALACEQRCSPPRPPFLRVSKGFVFQFWQSLALSAILAIPLICAHLRNPRRKGLAFDFQFWQFLAISAILAIPPDQCHQC
jgi:hypothetical protein